MHKLFSYAESVYRLLANWSHRNSFEEKTYICWKHVDKSFLWYHWSELKPLCVNMNFMWKYNKILKK